jgi:hypothetical protein
MVKLMIQNNKNKQANKQKHQVQQQQKKFSVLGKSSGVIPLVFSPGIGACYSGF